MEHHITKFKEIYAEHGLILSQEEATEQFFKVLAFLRLIIQKERRQQQEQLDALIRNQVADIINQ